MMNREAALSLVNEWTKAPHLLRHMLAVEAAMRAYARLFGEDEDIGQHEPTTAGVFFAARPSSRRFDESRSVRP